MPAGSFVGLLFFVLIFFAALTSSISLLEAVVAWAIKKFQCSRAIAAWGVGGVIFLVGVACALSLNIWSEVRILGFWGIFADANIMDTIDGFVGKVLLPVAALITTIFIGWKADKKLVDDQTSLSGGKLAFYRFLTAWISPIAVSLILIFGLFPSLLA
jgi:NSS family neurotransmitter:Na+ symporter